MRGETRSAHAPASAKRNAEIANGMTNYQTAIVKMPAASCATTLSFNRSAASVVEAVDHTMSPDGPWAERGLVIQEDTEDFGRVSTHSPVVPFSRTRLVARPATRAFGAERFDGWADAG